MMKKTLLSLFALSASLVGFAANPNPFAYAVSGEYDALTLDVAYSLNTAADKAEVQILMNGTVVKTQEVSATAGENTAEIDLSGLADGDYTWQIAVTGGETTGDAVEFFAEKWNHPRGVDTDRNFESPYFGNIYVTEGRNPGAAHYSYNNGGKGLYIFTPDMEGVINAKTNNYAFTGGLTLDQNLIQSTGTGTTSGADFCRVRVTEDGRIFLTRLNDNGDYLVQASTEDLIENDKLESVFIGGAVDATDYMYKINSTIVSAPNIGFDVYGKGENTKLVMLGSSKKHQKSSYTVKGATTTFVYNIGNSQTWNTAPSFEIVQMSGITAQPASANVTFDNRGGVWYSQYRGATTLSEEQPDLVYVDANNEEKYRKWDTSRGGGGFRFNADFTQVAIASSLTEISIYSITYAEDNTPSLTELKKFTHGIGTNVNDIAWDLAGNIYIVGNSSEYFKGFAVPRADNTFATKAASKYNFKIDTATGVETIGVDNAPVEYYNLQGVKVENPENGIFIKKQGNKAVKVIL